MFEKYSLTVTLSVYLYFQPLFQAGAREATGWSVSPAAGGAGGSSVRRERREAAAGAEQCMNAQLPKHRRHQPSFGYSLNRLLDSTPTKHNKTIMFEYVFCSKYLQLISNTGTN